MSNDKQHNIENKFKKLTDVEHILLRAGRYIGATSTHTSQYWKVDEANKKMVSSELTWNPALLKIFDEIISNSVDFSKTDGGKKLTTIKITLDKETGRITVYDDGGIVVHKHSEYDQWIPELIFELRAGSNFNDDVDSEVTGQNGEGAALTKIYSTEFKVTTADSKNKFEQIHTNNSNDRTVPIITPCKEHFTEISFIPDYKRFNISGLDDGNYARIVKRIYDVAGCNPKLKIFLNGTRIAINNFSEYVSMYTKDFIIEENFKWRVAIAPAMDGTFKHISFVNGTETLIGGHHISYIKDQITEALKAYFKKKHKIEVKSNEISNHFMLFIDCSIVKPRYSSQTKEDLITEIKNFGTSIKISDKFIEKLTESSIIQSVIDWVEAKAEAAERAELRKLSKDLNKTNPKSVEKFNDATSKNRLECMIFITEGDSAKTPFLAARDTKTMACFPLKGKPSNVYEMTNSEVINNEEFVNLMTIIGLKLGEKAELRNIRFGKIVIATDQDRDGYGIRMLLMNTFYKYWPELFTQGVIHILNTPIVKVTVGKNVTSFYSIEEYTKWQTVNSEVKYTSKYYKGLGTASIPEFEEYLSKANLAKNLVQVSVEDKDKALFKLLFSKEKGMADKRKIWINLSDIADKAE